MSSDYKLNFLSETCQVLCTKHWSEKEVADVKERIDNEYMVRVRVQIRSLGFCVRVSGIRAHAAGSSRRGRQG